MYSIFLVIIVQILLESLPISSSTHLMLMKSMLHIDQPLLQQKAFEFMMHVPTVAVILLFFLRRDFWYWWRVLPYLFISTLTTVLLYPLMHAVGALWPLSWGLSITCALLFFSSGKDRNNTPLTSSAALFLGVVQAIALLPGISRLAITMIAGLWWGLSKKTSFYYSCALQLPLFGVAGLYGLITFWGSAPALYDHVVPITLLLSITILGAYGLLCLTEWLFFTNRLWYVSIYLSIVLAGIIFLC